MTNAVGGMLVEFKAGAYKVTINVPAFEFLRRVRLAFTLGAAEIDD